MRGLRLSQGQERLLVYLVFGAFVFLLGCRARASDLRIDWDAACSVAAGDWRQVYAAKPFAEAFSAASPGAVKSPVVSLPIFDKTPAVVWALHPICGHLSWRTFVATNALVEALALIAVIELTARCWAARFLSPLAAAATLTASIFSEPVWAGIGYGQIQLVMLAGIIFALASPPGAPERPATRGLALALPVAVKPFPGMLLFHLLAARRRSVAAWFLLGTVGLAVFGFLVSSPEAIGAFLAVLHDLAGRDIVTLHNQSFVAAVSYRRTGEFALGETRWSMVATTVGIVLAAISSVAGGLLARKPGRQGEGACFSLVGVTVFAPLAWDHYFVVLIPAAMVLLARLSPWRIAAVLAIFGLSVIPVGAFQSWSATPHLAFRPLFLAALIALAALAAAALGDEPGEAPSGRLASAAER